MRGRPQPPWAVLRLAASIRRRAACGRCLSKMVEPRQVPLTLRGSTFYRGGGAGRPILPVLMVPLLSPDFEGRVVLVDGRGTGRLRGGSYNEPSELEAFSAGFAFACASVPE